MPTKAKELERLERMQQEENEFVENVAKALKKADKSFSEKAKIMRQEGEDIYNPEYNLVLVFQSKRQKDEFIRKTKGLEFFDETFVDGFEFAESVGVKLTTSVSQSIPKPVIKDKLRFLVDWKHNRKEVKT